MKIVALRLRWSVVCMSLVAMLVAAAGCAGVVTPTPSARQDGSEAGGRRTEMGAPAAVADAVATIPSRAQTTPNGPATAPDGTASWKTVQRKVGAVTYSYKYPPAWTADLSYCAPGAARNASGNELPARCASTDILVGQKAKDIGHITGLTIAINGKQAVKQIEDNPPNGMASRIYTLIVYDPASTPLVGFSTSIGPGTDEATRNSITATLDKVAATLVVSK